MKKEIICTVCPKGCHIQVEGTAEHIDAMSGFTCNRGKEYAAAEFTHPVRILTSTVKIKGSRQELLPVRSSSPIPKELLQACMEEIHKIQAVPPIAIHDVVLYDICGTGTNIIASKSIS